MEDWQDKLPEYKPTILYPELLEDDTEYVIQFLDYGVYQSAEKSNFKRERILFNVMFENVKKIFSCNMTNAAKLKNWFGKNIVGKSVTIKKIRRIASDTNEEIQIIEITRKS